MVQKARRLFAAKLRNKLSDNTFASDIGFVRANRLDGGRANAMGSTNFRTCLFEEPMRNALSMSQLPLDIESNGLVTCIKPPKDQRPQSLAEGVARNERHRP